MSKATFIHPEWLGILERASRAASGFSNLEEAFLQLRRDLMADYAKLKAEVDETVSGVRAVIAKLSEVSGLLKEAQTKIDAGLAVDYSELTSQLDSAQAEMAEAIKPAEVVAETAPPAEAPAEPVEPPGEPTP